MWGTEPELLVVLDRPERPDGVGPDGCADPTGPGDRAGPAEAVEPPASTGLSAPDPLAALARFGTVTSALHPRLALLAVASSRAPEVGAVAGVRGVFADEVPPALRETFSPAECLFVDGWLARKVAKRRDPPGGEPWDTPGRRPPDPPPDFRPDAPPGFPAAPGTSGGR